MLDKVRPAILKNSGGDSLFIKIGDDVFESFLKVAISTPLIKELEKTLGEGRVKTTI